MATQIQGHLKTIKERDELIKKQKSDLSVVEHTAQKEKEMENLVHDAKLQISELKIENQDLLTENRKLKVQIEEVNVESDLARADEMDVKI